MFSAVEHYPNHAPPAPAQWPTALNALGPLRDRHALEICNSPHAKAITRRRSFYMGRRHEMCLGAAQRFPKRRDAAASPFEREVEGTLCEGRKEKSGVDIDLRLERRPFRFIVF